MKKKELFRRLMDHGVEVVELHSGPFIASQGFVRQWRTVWNVHGELPDLTWGIFPLPGVRMSHTETCDSFRKREAAVEAKYNRWLHEYEETF